MALVELSTRPAPWPASHIEIAFDEDIPDERRVRLETRMGAISLDRSRVVGLPSGLPGFQGARSFALVRLPGTRFDPFLLMQLVEDPTTSFLVLSLDMTTLRPLAKKKARRARRIGATRARSGRMLGQSFPLSSPPVRRGVASRQSTWSIVTSRH